MSQNLGVLEDKIIKVVVFYNSFIGCNNFKPYKKVNFISCKGVQKLNSRIGWACTCKNWLHPLGQDSLIKVYNHGGIPQEFGGHKIVAKYSDIFESNKLFMFQGRI